MMKLEINVKYKHTKKRKNQILMVEWIAEVAVGHSRNETYFQWDELSQYKDVCCCAIEKFLKLSTLW